MVDMIVARIAPVILECPGFLKVLRPNMPAGDLLLLLLYQQESKGADLPELRRWVRPSMRRNPRRTLDRLVMNMHSSIAAGLATTSPRSARQRWPHPYNSVNGSTSITSAVALHFCSRAKDCARRNSSLSAVRLAALMRN